MQDAKSKSTAPDRIRYEAASPTASASDLRNPSRILRDLTDLFVSRSAPTGAEVMRFEEIACRLARSADAPALTYVAAKLASDPCAPVVLLDTLLGLDRTCAMILAEHCPRLSPTPLLAYAEGPDSALAAAVARRPRLTPQLVSALAARTESSVLCALASNRHIELPAATLQILVDIARHDEKLARILLQRHNDPAVQAPLFLHADAPARINMLLLAERHTFLATDIQRVRPIGPALRAWMARKNPVEHHNAFAREFARLIGLRPETILPLVIDPRGDGLALLLAAVAMPADEAVRIFLRCETAISHSLERIRTLRQIVETVPAHAAIKLIERIAGQTAAQPLQRAGRYIPLHDIAARPQSGRVVAASAGKQVPEKISASAFN